MSLERDVSDAYDQIFADENIPVLLKKRIVTLYPVLRSGLAASNVS